MSKVTMLDRAGWSIPDWCESVGISRAYFYILPPELKPESAKLGKRRIITEQPGDYLKRRATQTATLSEAA